MNTYFLQKKVWNLLFSTLILFTLSQTAFSYTSKIDITNNVYKHNSNGVSLLKNKKYNQAISEFKLAIALNPDNSNLHPIYNNLGVAYMELAKLYGMNGDNGLFSDNVSQAEVAFKDAIYFSPVNINYYENLADCFMLAQNRHELYLSINSKSYQYPEVMKIIMLKKMGKYAEAQAMADKFIKNNPDLVVSKNLKNILK